MKSSLTLHSLPSMRRLSVGFENLLLGSAKSITLDKNDMLFRQGELPKALYFIEAGLLRMSVTGITGREAAIGILEPGLWFGEASLITETAHDVNAYALMKSKLASVPKAEFHQIINQYPAFGLEFMGMICSRYKWALQWIDSSILLSFPVRLAQRLLWAQRLLPESNSSDPNVLKVSQEDLGHMLGISRQSINKQLKKWEAEGIVQVSYGRIKLLDIKAIEEIIEGL